MIKIISPLTSLRRTTGLVAAVLLFPLWSGPLPLWAAEASAVVDDFSSPEHTYSGAGRMVITDKDAGGQSTAAATYDGGVLKMVGKLAPGRGMPGFVSVPLMLNPTAQPQDLSAFTGVRLRVKVSQGMLMVQVASADITNFDFHTSAAIVRQPGDFQEVRIPFAKMNRAWSEQVPLNLKVITSVNLVAAGMAPGAFTYEVDEIGFY